MLFERETRDAPQPHPPHRHDEDDFPRMTYLEETYYHRLNPAQGFGLQRVWTEDGTLDETMAVADHDVVLVPKGHHPCGAPYGYEMYYLNVMAGSGPTRAWLICDVPNHTWLRGSWEHQDVDPRLPLHENPSQG